MSPYHLPYQATIEDPKVFIASMEDQHTALPSHRKSASCLYTLAHRICLNNNITIRIPITFSNVETAAFMSDYLVYRQIVSHDNSDVLLCLLLAIVEAIYRNILSKIVRRSSDITYLYQRETQLSPYTPPQLEASLYAIFWGGAAMAPPTSRPSSTSTPPRRPMRRSFPNRPPRFPYTDWRAKHQEIQGLKVQSRERSTIAVPEFAAGILDGGQGSFRNKAW